MTRVTHDDAALKESRDNLWAIQRLLEKSGGPGGKPTPRICAIVRRPFLVLRWRYHFSLIRSLVSEIGTWARRISGTVTHNPSQGVLVDRHQNRLPDELANARTYQHACNLCMQELEKKYSWFGSLDMLIGLQAFHWGSEWSSGRTGSNSENNQQSDS